MAWDGVVVVALVVVVCEMEWDVVILVNVVVVVCGMDWGVHGGDGGSGGGCCLR